MTATSTLITPGSITVAKQGGTPLPPNRIRKREGEDHLEMASSPGKRLKMEFSFPIEPTKSVSYDKAPALIFEEVRSAIGNRSWGDGAGYERLKEIFERKGAFEDEDTVGNFRYYILALTANVSSLDKACSDLVESVLRSNWLEQDDEYISIFTKFLAALITTHGSFLSDTLEMLIENVTASPSCRHCRPATAPAAPKSVIYSHVHIALRYLLQLFPSAGNRLLGYLKTSFPHQNGSRKDHVIYTQNLLKIADYMPGLQIDILALIIDRMVKLDVHVQNDIEDLEEELGEDVLDDAYEMRNESLEQFDDDKDDSDNESESEEEDFEVEKRTAIRKNVQSMDAVLDLLFSYYHQWSLSAAIGSEKSSLIDLLLSQFTTTILPALHSRHTQFLIFHFAQQSAHFTDLFVGTCVDKILDKSQPMLIRQNSAAYLASFVARGIRVPSNIVQDVFDYISDELSRLRKSYEVSCTGPDLRRYSSYYCLMQALLYMFCFRWRDLENSLEDEEENDVDQRDELHHNPFAHARSRRWVAGVKETFSANIFSKLNPLKICAPSIVEEFARISHHLALIYVYHLIEANKRIRLPRTMSLGSGFVSRETALSAFPNESDLVLDAYFPFDPYHLLRSKRWLEGDYREWVPIPGLHQDEDDGSDDEILEKHSEHAGSDVEEGTETDITASSL